MDETPTAFQLTDEAKKQIEAFKDGDKVEFIYHESLIEQQTIEAFIIEKSKYDARKQNSG